MEAEHRIGWITGYSRFESGKRDIPNGRETWSRIDSYNDDGTLRKRGEEHVVTLRWD